MHRIIYIFLVAATVFAAVSCNKKTPVNGESSRQVLASVGSLLTKDPDKALRIADSAYNAGCISFQSSELTRARIYYMKNSNDTAMSIINALLDDRSLDNVAETKADALIMKTQIAMATNDMTCLIKSAEEASDLCLKIGGRYVYMAANMECKIGYFMYGIGEKEEALKRIDDAVGMLEDDGTLTCFQSVANCLRTKSTILLELNHMAETALLCDSVLVLIAEKRNCSDPEFSPDEAKPMLDHYKGGFLVKKVIALAAIGETDKAKTALQECVATDWSKRPASAIWLLRAYAALEMFDEFEKTLEVVENINEGNETGVDFVFSQFKKAEMANKKGEYEKCIEAYRYASELQKQMYERRQKEELSRLMVLYKVNESSQEIYESRIKLFRLRMWLIIVSVMLVAVVWTAVNAIRKNRWKMEAFQNLMERIKGDDECLPTTPDTNNADNDSSEHLVELYGRIVQYMNDSRPYVDVNFDVDKIAKALKTNKTYVSRAINTIGGKSFKLWLADYRNKIIVDAICNNHRIGINDLCEMAGYATRETLHRNFVKINGITITEFKEQLAKQETM